MSYIQVSRYERPGMKAVPPFWFAGGAAAPVIFVLGVTEGGAAADTATAAMTAALTVTEVGAATDLVSAGMTAALTVTETGAATDLISAAMTAALTVAEAASALDTSSASMSAALAIAELANTLDAQVAGRQADTSVVEAGAVSDATDAALGVFSTTVLETAAITDAQSAAMTAVLSVVEIGVSLDAAIQGFIDELQQQVAPPTTGYAKGHVNARKHAVEDPPFKGYIDRLNREFERKLRIEKEDQLVVEFIAALVQTEIMYG